jgi:hypothetical protein
MARTKHDRDTHCHGTDAATLCSLLPILADFGHKTITRSCALILGIAEEGAIIVVAGSRDKDLWLCGTCPNKVAAGMCRIHPALHQQGFVCGRPTLAGNAGTSKVDDHIDVTYQIWNLLPIPADILYGRMFSGPIAPAKIDDMVAILDKGLDEVSAYKTCSACDKIAHRKVFV